jgi:hypothetical protein
MYDQPDWHTLVPIAVGKSTGEMKSQSNYIGWNFSQIWKMGEDGYPALRWSNYYIGTMVECEAKGFPFVHGVGDLIAFEW